MSRFAYIALLCLAWILPGLVAHDPWKPSEAYTFGVVYELLQGGSWVIPSIAGEPFLDNPPLYYLTAAAAALAGSSLLPLHDAARLATGFYMGLTFLFCALAGRELHGSGRGTLAALLLMGCFGLVVRGHQLITDVAALAGFAMAYYGWSLAMRRMAGGWWVGTGTGVIFLSQGMLEAGIAVLISLLLPLVNPAWRTRSYAAAGAIGLAAMLPWITIWPVLLHTQAPDLFSLWLASDALGQIFGAAGPPDYYLRILPWYAWPVWALALWALVQLRNGPAAHPALLLPLTGFLATLLVLSVATDKRELHALPLLLPLVLLATPAIDTLKRGAANAWYWFSVMGVTFFILVAWFYWTGLELGVPARLHAHLHRIQPGYDPGFKWLPFTLAAVYTTAWFVVLFKLPRNPRRPAIVWAAGITLVWGLLSILFVGWVDAGKSYRAVTLDLQRALPASYRCIASRDLGDSQRAMLHYHAGIITHREEITGQRRSCDLLLVQGRVREEQAPAGPWRKIWEGSRPGDKDERFRLYQRRR